MDLLLDVFSKKFTSAYCGADKGHWEAALWASRVVGKYERGATMVMAKATGVKVDTIEDHAHAYNLFQELCDLSLEHRKFTFAARRAPFIHYSHFRAIYDAREKYQLSTQECFSILMDIVQAEGELSSRDVDTHAQGRYGKEPSWEYHAQKAQRELSKTLLKLPHDKSLMEGKQILQQAFDWIGDNV